MPSFTNTFGGTVIYPSSVSYRAVALTANVTFAWPTELATDTNVVAEIMDVTPWPDHPRLRVRKRQKAD